MKEKVVDPGRSAASGASSELQRWAGACIWLLPVWGLFLALSTTTHQPDPATEFRAYAEYVTTTPFLVSHLALSIVGAGLGAVGAVALAVRLAGTPGARSALRGASLFVVAQVVTASVFGAAAYAQPAVGRAFLAGREAAAQSIDADVYGPEVIGMAVLGLLAMVAGAVLLGRGAVRSGLAPVWASRVFAGAVPVFALVGLVVGAVQPVAGVAVAVSSGVLAVALTRR